MIFIPELRVVFFGYPEVMWKIRKNCTLYMEKETFFEKISVLLQNGVYYIIYNPRLAIKGVVASANNKDSGEPVQPLSLTRVFTIYIYTSTCN